MSDIRSTRCLLTLEANSKCSSTHKAEERGEKQQCEHIQEARKEWENIFLFNDGAEQFWVSRMTDRFWRWCSLIILRESFPFFSALLTRLPLSHVLSHMLWEGWRDAKLAKNLQHLCAAEAGIEMAQMAQFPCWVNDERTKTRAEQSQISEDSSWLCAEVRLKCRRWEEEKSGNDKRKSNFYFAKEIWISPSQ